MKCPVCAAESGGAAECPACGLIFAKWRERREKEKRDSLEALEGLEAAPKAAPNLWIGRGAAAAVVLVWLLGLCFYVIRRAPKRRPARQQSLRGKRIGPFWI